MNNKFFVKSFILSFVLSGVLFFSVLLPCFPVHAASDDQFSFPYVVPEWRNNTSAISDSLISSAESVIRTRFNLSENDNIMFFVTDLQSSLGTYQWNILYFIVNPSVVTQVDENFSFLDNNVTLSCSFSGTYEFKWDNSYRNIGQSYGNVSILGNSSVIEINQGVYTPRYPFYMSGDDILYGDFLVFTNEVPSVITPDVFDTGHAVEPSFDSDTIIDSGLHPNLLPSAPQYTTYNITTYQAPQIDTSSVENLLKSIWDVISYTGQYIISNVGGFINNIWNNISLAFGYIGDLLSYLFNKVINTIKQSIHNLFENFRDLFEPVLNSFANFINIMNTLYNLGLEDDVFNVGHLAQALFVPDQMELNSFLENHLELAVVGHAQETTGVLLNFINDVIESDPIYEVHIPRFYFYDRYMGGYTVSFDWYLDIKPTMDTIISGFLIVGYFFWLFVRLPGILHGTAPDSSDAAKLMKELDIKG